jgi:signal transduction histidine kinase
MGGQIKVDSQKNVGTQFTLLVPNRYHEASRLRDSA